MNKALFEVLCSFCLDAEPVSCVPYGCGHINETYLTVTASGRRYILQKINHHTFRDVAGLMENVTSVTDFLHTKAEDPRSVLTLVKTTDGASYLHAQEEYWRAYDFVESSICLQQPETDEDFFQSAVGFGTFQQLLSDFPAEKLHDTIPNFHNTPDRYRAFLETLERDSMHRAAQVQPEIEFALARQAEMAALQTALKSGELPLRVTHNDTKLNNVLLDAKTRRALCVIDLDTVMPGSSLYDFGDSIRFGAATAAEDERDLSKMAAALIVVYAALWKVVGFMIATLLFITTESKVLKKDAPLWQCSLVALGADVVIYLIFVRLFSISLPETFLRAIL